LMNTCQNGTIEPYLKLSNSSSYLFFSPYSIINLIVQETGFLMKNMRFMQSLWQKPGF
jgi:hypothetical protein